MWRLKIPPQDWRSWLQCGCSSECETAVVCEQAGEIAEAVKSYEQAVKLAGKSAPGVYKLMGQLARRSAAGTRVAVEQLQSSLPPVESLPAQKIDELEDAAAGNLSPPFCAARVPQVSLCSLGCAEAC